MARRENVKKLGDARARCQLGALCLKEHGHLTDRHMALGGQSGDQALLLLVGWFFGLVGQSGFLKER
jgi:hypothetical protein